jgi:hypothetical protein
MMVGAVLAIFGVAGIGALIRRMNWLTEQADASLLTLVVRVLIPALIWHVVVGNERLRQAENLVLPPLVGFATLALGLAIGLVVARLLGPRMGLTTPAKRRTFALCVGVYNYSYVPLPLAQQFFDQGTVGVLFVHNMGVDVAMWTLGIVLLTGGLGPRWWLRLVNGPIIAIVAALIFNYLHLDQYVPAFVESGIGMLGQCAVPMGLVLIGATVADYVRRGDLRQGAAVMTAGCALRLGLIPASFLVLATVLPASLELQRVMAIEAAMPSGVFTILIARHYGGDPATAVRVVLATSLVSLLTVPLWLSGGFAWLGLRPL